jgi:hypothetical protein
MSSPALARGGSRHRMSFNRVPWIADDWRGYDRVLGYVAHAS